MRDYHVVSFSGGKDSTAMLLRMLELSMPIEEIIFCDTGAEFPQMYDHIARVEKYIGRPITRLKAERDFYGFMFDYEVSARRTKNASYHDKGLSWPSARIRWCTRRLKADIADKYAREKAKEYNLVQYVGIAADEQHRAKAKCYPLIDWGWTEQNCLDYCKSKGFDWGGLYDIFKRVSCWLCPLQRMDSLKALRHNFPELWKTLLELEHKTWRTFRSDYSVDELEAKFAAEDEMEHRQVKLFKVV